MKRVLFFRSVHMAEYHRHRDFAGALGIDVRARACSYTRSQEISSELEADAPFFDRRLEHHRCHAGVGLVWAAKPGTCLI